MCQSRVTIPGIDNNTLFLAALAFLGVFGVVGAMVSGWCLMGVTWKNDGVDRKEGKSMQCVEVKMCYSL
jgi:hypothetical protein